jgi:isopentenyl phosphate kinase
MPILPEPPDVPFLVLKIGGSLFSDKSKDQDLDHRLLDRYARLVGALARRHPGRIVLVSGGGSLGHGALRTCANGDPFAIAGLTEATFRVKWAWAAALRGQGVRAFPLQVAAMCLVQPNGLLVRGEVLRAVLRAGGLPVLAGDCLIDADGKLRTLSSDRVPEVVLAVVPGACRVVILTDVPGILVDGPDGMAVLPTVEAGDPSAAYRLLWPPTQWDSTGGMREKLDALVACAEKGAECFIMRGDPGLPDLDFLYDPAERWPAAVRHTRIALRSRELLCR